MKKSKNTRVIFRCDGNNQMGLGHIYRSLALFQMLNNQFSCQFFVRRPDSKLKSLIQAYCPMTVIESLSPKEEETELQTLLKATDIVVIDGYQFDTSYQRLIKSKVSRVVVIDDLANGYFVADIIINQGNLPLNQTYQMESYTKVLTGLKYLLVRKEFLFSAQTKRKISKINSVFICMGGADPFNVTIKAFLACTQCDFIKDIFVVTGSAYNYLSELKELIEKNTSKKQITHAENVSAERIVELIQLSAMSICPSSSIALEVCCVRSGLLTGSVVDNQVHVHNLLVGSKCCRSVGDFNKVSIKDLVFALNEMNDIELLNDMMERQFELIDGLSGERLLDEFTIIANA